MNASDFRAKLSDAQPTDVPWIAAEALIAILDVMERILDHIESDEVQL